MEEHTWIPLPFPSKLPMPGRLPQGLILFRAVSPGQAPLMMMGNTGRCGARLGQAGFLDARGGFPTVGDAG